MRIHNADGGEVAACGNASRCVAALVMEESGTGRCIVETRAGLLQAEAVDGERITVDMGAAGLAWQDIPLAREADTRCLDMALGPLSAPVAVSIGNPHAVFFVEDADAVELARLGPELEHHRMFPERANIGVAQVTGPDRLRVRVWERGVGLTRACGTGACAAAVAAHRRELTGRQVEVVLDGGPLAIEWRADGHVLMTGPVATSFTGELAEALLP
jgi:diaminopimelate epimerase